MSKLYFKIFEIKNWGFSAVIVSDKGLKRSFLPVKNKDEISNEFLLQENFFESEERCRDYVKFIKEYFNKEKSRFNFYIDWDNTSDFFKKVYKSCMNIPYGKTRSYSDLAKEAGNKNAARAVGNAMASNPIPIIIPCHRVLRADRSLGGFGGGLELKKNMLVHEGINIETIKDK